MIKDPIVEEVRKARKKIEEKYGNNIEVFSFTVRVLKRQENRRF